MRMGPVTWHPCWGLIQRLMGTTMRGYMLELVLLVLLVLLMLLLAGVCCDCLLWCDPAPWCGRSGGSS